MNQISISNNLLSQSFDLQNKFNNLNTSFIKILDQMQCTWKNNLLFNLIKLKDAEKNILINALPGIEAFFLEKLRLSWTQFKTRFQQKMLNENTNYQLLCTTVVNVENKLMSFHSMFFQMEINCNGSNNNDNFSGSLTEKKSKFQFSAINILNFPKVLYNRTILPKRIHNLESRRYHKEVILLKGIPISHCKFIGNGHLRLAHPDYNLILSEGFNFGKVELALNMHGHFFAVKQFLKNSKMTMKVAIKLKSLMNNLIGLNSDNILPYTHCIEHVTELWLGTPLCDYNLENYIDLVNKKPNMYALNTQSAVKQIINGLRYLHLFNNGIVHGNMKPSNILIDAVGNMHLADFGIVEAIYKVKKPRPTDITWWSRETIHAYESNSTVKFMCNKETDIQTLGMMIHFTLTKGEHPFGNNFPEISKNIKKGHKIIRLNNAEQYQIVKNCLSKYASKRPSIDIISKHVFLWTDQKKWDFLMECVEMQCLETSEFGNFSKSLDTVAKNNWDNYLISMGLKNIGEKKSVNCCMPSKYLYYISNDVMLTRKNTDSHLIELAKSYLSTFPTLTFTIVNLVQCTKWANIQCLQKYLHGLN